MAKNTPFTVLFLFLCFSSFLFHALSDAVAADQTTSAAAGDENASLNQNSGKGEDWFFHWGYPHPWFFHPHPWFFFHPNPHPLPPMPAGGWPKWPLPHPHPPMPAGGWPKWPFPHANPPFPAGGWKWPFPHFPFVHPPFPSQPWWPHKPSGKAEGVQAEAAAQSPPTA